MTKKDNANDITAEIKAISLLRLSEAAKNNELSLQENALDDKLKKWNALILIASVDTKILVQINFDILNIIGLANNIFTEVEEHEYASFSKDFVKEYCNLIAGLIKARFCHAIPLQIGIPMISTHVEPKTFFGPTTKDVYEWKWCIKDGTNGLNVTCLIKFEDSYEAKKLISKNEAHQEQSTEVEFF